MDSFWDEPTKSREIEEDEPLTLSTAAQPMRQRLDTEETRRIRNGMSPPDETPAIQVYTPASDAESRNEMEALDLCEDDGNSVVSSLSNDEDSLFRARRNAKLPPIRESRVDLAGADNLPPVEVAIPTSASKPERPESRMDELIANLALSHSRSHESPPRLVTRGPSPSVLRPTLGRNKSCPVTMDFSVTSSNYSSIARSEDTIIVNGSVVGGVKNRDGDSWDRMHPKDSRLLGDRKRRVHRRNNTGTEISLGSIVGQSTLHTANTSMASYTDSEASSVRKALKSAVSAGEKLLNYTGAADGIACCQARRPQNVVKKELKFVVGQLTSPIRKIPLFREKKADLKRAKGSLV